MKASILKEDLYRGLGYVGKIVTSRGQLPILNNVLIDANKEGISLVATNLEMGLRVNIGGQVLEEGSITVPAKNLTELVGSLDEGIIELVLGDEKLKVMGKNSRGIMTGTLASEFPVVPKISNGKKTKIPKKIFAEISQQVAFAAAVDESRPVLTGVRFEASENKLKIIATDGFRLSRKFIDSAVFNEIGLLVLPARTVLELGRIAGDEHEDEIKMETVSDNNQVIFECGKVQLVSRLLEGNYPEVDKIIPQDFKTDFKVDRKELEKVLKTASIFARENNNIVKFKINDSELVITAQASQIGENEGRLEIEKDGEDGEIAFNYKFLQDFISSREDERLHIKINDSLSPGVFMGEDETLLHLIMPVRV